MKILLKKRRFFSFTTSHHQFSITNTGCIGTTSTYNTRRCHRQKKSEHVAIFPIWFILDTAHIGCLLCSSAASSSSCIGFDYRLGNQLSHKTRCILPPLPTQLPHHHPAHLHQCQVLSASSAFRLIDLEEGTWGDLLRSVPHIKNEVKLNSQANCETNSK